MIKLALSIAINVSIIMFAGWGAWFAYQVGMFLVAPAISYVIRGVRAGRPAPRTSSRSAKRSAPALRIK